MNKKIDYYVVPYPEVPDGDTMYRSYGQFGWDLVQVVVNPHGLQFLLIFKRELAE